jgi:hypothetical protein
MAWAGAQDPPTACPSQAGGLHRRLLVCTDTCRGGQGRRTPTPTTVRSRPRHGATHSGRGGHCSTWRGGTSQPEQLHRAPPGSNTDRLRVRHPQQARPVSSNGRWCTGGGVHLPSREDEPATKPRPASLLGKDSIEVDPPQRPDWGSRGRMLPTCATR